MAPVVGVAAGLCLVPRSLASLWRTRDAGICVEVRPIMTILLVLVSVDLLRKLVLGEGMRWEWVVFVFWQSPARLQYAGIQPCMAVDITVIIL